MNTFAVLCSPLQSFAVLCSPLRPLRFKLLLVRFKLWLMQFKLLLVQFKLLPAQKIAEWPRHERRRVGALPRRYIGPQ